MYSEIANLRFAYCVSLCITRVAHKPLYRKILMYSSDHLGNAGPF